MHEILNVALKHFDVETVEKLEQLGVYSHLPDLWRTYAYEKKSPEFWERAQRRKKFITPHVRTMKEEMMRIEQFEKELFDVVVKCYPEYTFEKRSIPNMYFYEFWGMLDDDEIPGNKLFDRLVDIGKISFQA